MKALTVRQPWASLIMAGAKTEEYRTRPTSHRGLLAIHSGGALPTWADHEAAAGLVGVGVTADQVRGWYADDGNGAAEENGVTNPSEARTEVWHPVFLPRSGRRRSPPLDGSSARSGPLRPRDRFDTVDRERVMPRRSDLLDVVSPWPERPGAKKVITTRGRWDSHKVEDRPRPTAESLRPPGEWE